EPPRCWPCGWSVAWALPSPVTTLRKRSLKPELPGSRFVYPANRGQDTVINWSNSQQTVCPAEERLRPALEHWPVGWKHVHARKLFAAHPMVCPDLLGRRIAERSNTSDYV